MYYKIMKTATITNSIMLEWTYEDNVTSSAAVPSLLPSLATGCRPQVNSALHPSGVAKSSTSFSWRKGGKVTSAGWQVTLCDLIWFHVAVW